MGFQLCSRGWHLLARRDGRRRTKGELRGAGVEMSMTIYEIACCHEEMRERTKVSRHRRRICHLHYRLASVVGEGVSCETECPYCLGLLGSW